MSTYNTPMLLEKSTDEDFDLEIQIGLLGDEEERQEAATKLFNRYKERLMIFLENKRPYLPADDAATAVNEAIIEIFRMGETRPKDLESPLRPLLFTIADRRAIDLLRKQSRRIKSDDQITEDIGDALRDTDTGNAWSDFCRESENKERLSDIKQEFNEFIVTLPKKQRLVAGVIADDFQLNDHEISEELRLRSNMVVPVVEIKGAKQALMKKFRELLKKKGLV
jgi:RNA polymerase sigma factor (sigma-70 family)